MRDQNKFANHHQVVEVNSECNKQNQKLQLNGSLTGPSKSSDQCKYLVKVKYKLEMECGT